MQLSFLLSSLALFHAATVAFPIAGRAENSTSYGGISWVSGLDGSMLEYCRPLVLKWAADGPINITITKDPVCPGGYRSCPVVETIALNTNETSLDWIVDVPVSTGDYVINLFAAKGAVYSTKRHTIPPSNTSCDQSLLHLAFDQASLEPNTTTKSNGTEGGGADGDKSNGGDATAGATRVGGLQEWNVVALVSVIGVGSALLL